MTKENNFKTYDRIMVVVCLIVLAMLLMTSCTTQRGTNYQDHLRTTPTQNWVTRDNGGCGWNR